MNELTQRLAQQPSLLKTLSFSQFLLFIDLCVQLRPLLELATTSTLPPLALDNNVLHFLSRSISSGGKEFDIQNVEAAWDTLSDFIWSMPNRLPSASLLPLFLKYGTRLGIGFITIRPEYLHCTNTSCTDYGQRLKRPSPYSATLFTYEYGPMPAFQPPCTVPSLSRTYHDRDTLPTIIHVSQKAFLDPLLCEFFADLMTFGHVSFTNCSRIYNTALRKRTENLRSGILPSVKVPQLDPDHVSEAFVIYILLLDAIRRGFEICRDDPITVPHKETLQRGRYLHHFSDPSSHMRVMDVRKRSFARTTH